MASSVVNAIDKVTECPICLEIMKKPIIQCKYGHSMCESCVNNSIKSCPTCRGEMSTIRNYNLEQLIETIEKSCKIKCSYTNKGCKYLLEPREKQQHELECKFRLFQCEGKKFCKWQCMWTGSLNDMEKHYKDLHKNHTWMSFKTEVNLKIDFNNDFHDIHLINFHNGQHYFWYKHKIDVKKQKAYWTIQMIATKQLAKNYYYEFEIYNGPTRKFKIIEICQNDTIDANKIFNDEKCVVVSFQSLKNYLNSNHELPFKFRIMSIKKHTTD